MSTRAETSTHDPSGKPNAWMRDCLFNLLIDYYPEVPGRPYGSGATRENVLPVLQDLRFGFLCIYAKGHSGRTTFPSALRTEHVMLAKDMPAFFREVTRETDTRLMLYYSGLVDGIAGLRHPDWRMIKHDGTPAQVFDDFFLGYPICPLSPYFDEWVSVHLTEMIERYEPDGIWVDGDWPGPCYCPRCEARFRAETGFAGPMPPPASPHPETGMSNKANQRDPVGIAFNQVWANITYEWRERFAGFIKSLSPTCLYSAGNVSPRAEFSAPFDWRSGDWFTPNNHRYNQSVIARRYTTTGLPFDEMTCDTSFVHTWRWMRSRTKTLPRMLQEGAGVLANGGLWCYWTYPMPNGAFVPSRMRMAKAAAEFARERQDVSLRTSSVGWTAVLDAEKVATLPGNNVWGAGKALIALHRSPDVIDETRLTDDVSYDLIVVPEQPDLDEPTVERLERFVRRGGKLLSTGVSIHSPALRRLLGVELVKTGALTEGHVFLANGDPVGVHAPWDHLATIDADSLYRLFRTWDHDNPEIRGLSDNYPMIGLVDEENPEPAGFPGAVVRELGQGMAVHLPTTVFGTYWQYGYPDILAWLREVLDRLQPSPLFRTDAPSWVEISLRQKEDALLVHFVNGNPGRDLSWVHSNDLWVDEIPPIGPLTCRILCRERPRRLRWEPGGATVDAAWREGVLEVVLPRLEIHACLVVDGWQTP